MVAINNAVLTNSGEVAELAAMPTSAGLGGRTLDGTLSMYQAFRADPEAVDRAERAVSDEVLLAVDNGRGPRMMALDVLSVADRPQALELLDTAVQRATREGSLLAVSGAYAYRGRGLLVRGELDSSTPGRHDRQVGNRNLRIGEQVVRRPGAGRHLPGDGPVGRGQGRPGMVRCARRAVRSALHLLRPGILGRARTPRPAAPNAACSWPGWPASGSPQPMGSTRPWSIGGTRRRCACNSLAITDPRKSLLSRTFRSPANGVRPDPSAGRCDCLPPWWSRRPPIGLLDDAVTLLRPTTARLELAECLVALGRLKSTTGFDGSNDLAEGRALAMHCGAHPLVDQATAALRLADA